MPRDLTVVVGYSGAALASLQEMRPPGTVILVEEPDVIRKRGVTDALRAFPVVGELAAVKYHDHRLADVFLDSARALHVTSVVPILEYTTPFAARLAERLNLPGATLEASLAMRDKHRLRTLTRAHGVANPRSRLVEDLADIRRFADEAPGAIIIKPANRQGSVGTVIVHDRRNLEAAFAASRLRDEGVMVPDRGLPERTLVEDFVVGSEHSVEALVANGRILFSNVTQKELFEGTNPVERAHVVPAPVPASVAAHLVNNTQTVLDATGFSTGIVHCEWILSNGTAWLVECAGRFAGDGIIDLVRRAYGFDIVAAYHTLMRGEAPGILPQCAGRTATVRFLGGRDGRIAAIDVDPDVMSEEGVVDYHVMARVGDRAHVPAMSWHRLASVTAEAADAAAATAVAARALAGITVTYQMGADA